MTLNCKGKLIDITVPKVMGVLNITPDSFFDGGKHKNPSKILKHIEQMLREGATFIDIGAYSSRPGAHHIDEDEELHRILPIVTLILNEFPEALLSIDTFRSRVAEKCLQVGAAIINDISAGQMDKEMLDIIAKFQIPFVAMHMRGTPKDMMTQTNYQDLTKEIFHYFSKVLDITTKLKINDVIIDPGFGFAKTLDQNFELLEHLDLLNSLKKPLLVGVSRKSMIYRTVGTTADNALNGTTALHMAALERGADILRVHDVREAFECIQLYMSMKASKKQATP